MSHVFVSMLTVIAGHQGTSTIFSGFKPCSCLAVGFGLFNFLTSLALDSGRAPPCVLSVQCRFGVLIEDHWGELEEAPH